MNELQNTDETRDPAAPSQGGITTVEISAIVQRTDWQVREKINDRLVRDYVTHYVHGANMPPVRLANVNGALVLIDGWHRLRAQRQLNRSSVAATVEEMTEAEAQWQAALANNANGLRLKRSERRNVFEVYMKTGRYRRGRSVKSYREIARDLGGLATKSTIENWMKSGHPKIAARMASARDFNAGPDDPLKNRPAPYVTLTERVRGLAGQVVAEVRGVRCPVGRLAIAVELEKAAKAVMEAQPWKPEAIETNDDF